MAARRAALGESPPEAAPIVPVQQQQAQTFSATKRLTEEWQPMEVDAREALLRNAGTREDFTPHLAAMPWQHLPEPLRQRLQAGTDIVPAPSPAGDAVVRLDGAQAT